LYELQANVFEVPDEVFVHQVKFVERRAHISGSGLDTGITLLRAPRHVRHGNRAGCLTPEEAHLDDDDTARFERARHRSQKLLPNRSGPDVAEAEQRVDEIV